MVQLRKRGIKLKLRLKRLDMKFTPPVLCLNLGSNPKICYVSNVIQGQTIHGTYNKRIKQFDIQIRTSLMIINKRKYYWHGC